MNVSFLNTEFSIPMLISCKVETTEVELIWTIGHSGRESTANAGDTETRVWSLGQEGSLE